MRIRHSLKEEEQVPNLSRKPLNLSKMIKRLFVFYVSVDKESLPELNNIKTQEEDMLSSFQKLRLKFFLIKFKNVESKGLFISGRLPSQTKDLRCGGVSRARTLV